MAAVMVMWHKLVALTFILLSHGGSIWNLASNCLGVSKGFLRKRNLKMLNMSDFGWRFIMPHVLIWLTASTNFVGGHLGHVTWTVWIKFRWKCWQQRHTYRQTDDRGLLYYIWKWWTGARNLNYVTLKLIRSLSLHGSSWWCRTSTRLKMSEPVTYMKYLPIYSILQNCIIPNSWHLLPGLVSMVTMNCLLLYQVHSRQQLNDRPYLVRWLIIKMKARKLY